MHGPCSPPLRGDAATCTLQRLVLAACRGRAARRRPLLCAPLIRGRAARNGACCALPGQGCSRSQTPVAVSSPSGSSCTQRGLLSAPLQGRSCKLGYGLLCAPLRGRAAGSRSLALRSPAACGRLRRQSPAEGTEGAAAATESCTWRQKERVPRSRLLIKALYQALNPKP